MGTKFHTVSSMAMLLCLMLLGLKSGLAFGATNLESEGDQYFLTIRMPNVVAHEADELICTAMNLDPRESYIASCRTDSVNSTLYRVCNKEETSAAPTQNAVCLNDTRQIIFAWALDAPEKALPEGVGLPISGDTGINYLVVQLHYAKAFPPGVTDNSGYTVELTRTRPAQQVGYLVLGNWGVIPPQTPEFFLDSFCEFPLNATIYPIAYRTHSHNLGVVTSGYRIREGQWTEIGRNSPQLPQAFYNVSNPGMDVRPGDILASRCVMNSMSRDMDTKLGPKNHDEMCNFYIMYTTDEQRHLENTMCFQSSNPDAQLDDFPPDAGSLDGIPGAEAVKEKFNAVLQMK